MKPRHGRALIHKVPINNDKMVKVIRDFRTDLLQEIDTCYSTNTCHLRFSSHSSMKCFLLLFIVNSLHTLRHCIYSWSGFIHLPIFCETISLATKTALTGFGLKQTSQFTLNSLNHYLLKHHYQPHQRY